MEDDGQRALIEALESKGFAVDLQDTGRPSCDRFVCGLARGNLGKGCFGETELAAVRKAVEAVEGGRFEG